MLAACVLIPALLGRRELVTWKESSFANDAFERRMAAAALPAQADAGLGRVVRGLLALRTDRDPAVRRQAVASLVLVAERVAELRATGPGSAALEGAYSLLVELELPEVDAALAD